MSNILSSNIPIEGNMTLSGFISEYTKAIIYVVDYIWNTRIETKYINKETNQHKRVVLDIKKQKFDCPAFMPTIKFNTLLSERAVKCVLSQALGIVKSRIEKLNQMKWQLSKLMSEGKTCKFLQKKYDKLVSKLKKPIIKKVCPELDSNCIKYSDNLTNNNDGTLTLSSIGKSFGKIILPVNFHSHYNDLKNNGGQLMNSFLLHQDHVDFRFKFDVPLKTIGSIEGADQGAITCLTLSDGQITPNYRHPNSNVDTPSVNLNSLIKKLCKKKYNSKSFKKAQDERTNYINWAVNQLDLAGIKEIHLEKLRSMGKGKRKSRYLKHFVYKEIKIALEKRCLLSGIKLIETENVYMSQRCSKCGWVHKNNRKGKEFHCRQCGLHIDADLNSSLNHKLIPCVLPYNFWRLHHNKVGFWWTKEKIIMAGGHEFSVRDEKV